MWHIQTPLDGLLLPTDAAGRLRLTGHVPAWHHVVRLRERTIGKADGNLSAAPLNWEIRPWHQIGNRLYLPDATDFQDGLLQMVRSNAQTACTLATFPPRGKRVEDGTVHLLVVVPPERFLQYEALIRFAMTLPSGSVTLTLPTPFSIDANVASPHRQLLAAGHTSLLEEIELAVSRAPLTVYTRRDLRTERRTPGVAQQGERTLVDDDNEWLNFRRDERQLDDSIRVQ
jgi:hypothetical protein